MKEPVSKKSIWSWALYDAGNSAFATVVMAGFFPLFFKTYWSSGADVTVSTAPLGLANAAAGLLIALAAPLLGAMADSGRARKTFLGFFAAFGITATAALVLVGQGLWPYAAALYIAAAIGFSCANIFYDALLPAVARKDTLDRVSALGYAVGYLGGGLLFALCVWMVMRPEMFGLVSEALLKSASAAARRELLESARASAILYAFALTALWWAAFTLPLLLFVPEPAGAGGRPLRDGPAQLAATFREIRRLKAVWLFLLAYWFYIDGVDTIVRMAVDYGMSLGFSPSDLICALLITQFVGFPCAVLFGRMGERWGAKRMLYGAIAGYLGIVLWGVCMTDKREFYVLAVLVGFFQGGIQALSRSYFAGMIPPGKSAQFFGLYNMVGKYAAIAGPALMGVIGYLTGSPRAGIASIAVLFVIGGALLMRVDAAPRH